MKRIRILLLILFYMFFFKEVFSKELIIYSYEQLKDLKELRVGVLGYTESEGKAYGITSDSLRYYAEGRLRDAGIKINRDVEKECPFLYIKLDMQNNAYSISVDVFDKVKLARDPSISLYAIIWRLDFFSVPTQRPDNTDDPLYWDNLIKSMTEDSIMNTIALFFDDFLKAHRKANPEK